MVDILRETTGCGTIVKLQDVFRDEGAGTLTTACELMAGSDLLAAVGMMNKNNAKIERSQCRRFIWQLCDALNFLHTRGEMRFAIALQSFTRLDMSACAFDGAGIAHRDVRPENVLLTNKDPTSSKCTAKLNDFSTAIYVDGFDCQDQRLVGASGYMAPEMLLGDMEGDLLPLLDVWGLGACLYVMLTGKAPYPLDNTPETQTRIVRCASFSFFSFFSCPFNICNAMR
jgi:serine/threonine protein kinase